MTLAPSAPCKSLLKSLGIYPKLCLKRKKYLHKPSLEDVTQNLGKQGAPTHDSKHGPNKDVEVIKMSVLNDNGVAGSNIP